MAQVVQSKGWVGPLVTTVIGVILLLNGVPALIQWLPWVAQTALVMGMDYALETALVPVLLAGAATFIGFLMMRGGFGALRERARGAARRTQEQVRSGVQQVQREATQRYGEASSQAEHLVSKVPQSWRERINAAAAAVEQERAARAIDHAHPEWEGQGARRAAEQPQQFRGQGQQQGQGEQWQQGHQQPRQPQQQPPQQRQPPRQQQLPGGDRLSRIEELRSRVDSKVQQASQGQDAHRAAEQARRAAEAAAARVRQGLPTHLDEATEALVGRLDLADAERMRRRGSSLVRSSLTTSALSKTSLRTNSLFRHRR
ncbi:hypothetical protein SAMN04487783_1054 [Agrococcus baldri]|uniref:Uncharacterized protein n=1 Tax=Agrococcus baldri TaxID=153730 RepID=A0AA94HLM2_9MICO|nr:hypothetical protein [Agrococcus baldri]SFS08131.1 hypothetical protein SAMN04487783_1054 [Agrococcus baldri]